MKTVWAGFLLSTIWMLLLSGQARAWSCTPAGGFIIEDSENPLTAEEIRRLRSKWFANVLDNGRVDGDVVVFGQLFRKTHIPFLHEEQLDAIRARYWPPSDSVQMPYRIEYTYTDAYRFEGHQLLDGDLIPFVADSIDANVSISADYEGIIDTLPPTGSDVLGTLRAIYDGRRLELTTSLCPSYYQVSPAQVADLLECYNEGACR